MTTSVLIYLVLGLVIARIELDGTHTNGYTLSQWSQYLFNAARIIMLWPLVLFIDKLTIWLRTEPKQTTLVEESGLLMIDFDKFVMVDRPMTEAMDDMPA